MYKLPGGKHRNLFGQSKFPGGGGAPILQHTGMCYSNGVAFSQEIPKRGPHFLQKYPSNMDPFFQIFCVQTPKIFEKWAIFAIRVHVMLVTIGSNLGSYTCFEL